MWFNVVSLLTLLLAQDHRLFAEAYEEQCSNFTLLCGRPEGYPSETDLPAEMGFCWSMRLENCDLLGRMKCLQLGKGVAHCLGTLPSMTKNLPDRAAHTPSDVLC
jgi:hypothetical protein